MRPLLLTLTALLGPVAQAATVMRLGDTDTVYSEFTAPAGYQDQFYFDVGELPYLRSRVAIPSTLAESDADCLAHLACTSFLSIRFTVPESMDGFDFDLLLERLGSEYSAVLLDGETIGGVASAEGSWMATKFELGLLDAGPHSITLWAVGGNIGTSAMRAHWLDRIVLMAE